MKLQAVTTTGIFCRPSCAASPRADHVVPYESAETALADGYRPCLRCRPLRGSRLAVVATLSTALGPMVAAATDDGVCLLEFTERRMLPTQLAIVERRFGALVGGRHAYLERLQDELDAYFAGSLSTFNVPVVAPGSPFEEQVGSALREIPPGETRSYDELALALGRPGAARAVGRANGRNRIAILIPCHRVIGADGHLTGYGGGLWRKERLLALERGELPASSPPRPVGLRRVQPTAIRGAVSG
jgi:AraC family transcriptional regulator of adaptative response/methylated-DNA-[protein]-cysteine methyltransferase